MVSGIVSAITGNSAAKAQERAAESAAATQVDLGNRALDLQEPFFQRGDRAGQALEFELGLAERPVFRPDEEEYNALAPLEVRTIEGGPIYGERTLTGSEGTTEQYITGFDVDKFAVGDQEFTTRAAADNYLTQQLAERETQRPEAFEYQGFQETPGYQFRVSEGQKALERAAAAGGRLNSGATLKAAQRFGQNIAADEYGTYLNRLSALAGSGQVAASNSSSILQNQGNSLANLQLQRGNAQASSFNAIGGGINQTVGDLTKLAGFGFGGGF